VRIHVTSGTGEAQTELAAFDRALMDAGVASHNLIVLTSMIPPCAEVVRARMPQTDATWGQLLYVVLAQHRETRVGAEAWAGIGWVQDEETGRGMFVEHEGGSRHTVEAQIEASLHSMAGARAVDFGPVHMVTAGIICEEHPVCAVAVAAYGEPHPWSSPGGSHPA
jgi:arginine decarboxylase